MPATYRDLPEGIDPIAHLFGDEKLTVPESYFTPELTVRFYQRCLEEIDVTWLYSKNDKISYGLESLSSLLRFEPKSHNGYRNWLRLEAAKGLIGSALPERTPYQLQYLALFDFAFPDWKDIPLVTNEEWRMGAPSQVMGEVETTALLYGKNKQLYLVTARWEPEESYYGGGKEPSYSTDPRIFHLSALTVEVVEWYDKRILKRIENGVWSDVKKFKGRLHMVIQDSADVLEGRARVLRKAANLFDLDGMSIYSGR